MRKICPSNDLTEGTCRSFIDGDDHIFLTRKEGQVHAYDNNCPHLNIPLEWQENQFLDSDAELIQCATHGALFIIDSGLCVSGPCNGQSLQKREIIEVSGALYLP